MFFGVIFVNGEQNIEDRAAGCSEKCKTEGKSEDKLAQHRTGLVAGDYSDSHRKASR